MAFDFGKVERWKNSSGILYAQNDICKLAYAVFDPSIDERGLSFDLGIRNNVIVQFITPEQAKAWDNAETRD